MTEIWKLVPALGVPEMLVFAVIVVLLFNFIGRLPPGAGLAGWSINPLNQVAKKVKRERNPKSDHWME